MFNVWTRCIFFSRKMIWKYISGKFQQIFLYIFRGIPYSLFPVSYILWHSFVHFGDCTGPVHQPRRDHVLEEDLPLIWRSDVAGLWCTFVKLLKYSVLIWYLGGVLPLTCPCLCYNLTLFYKLKAWITAIPSHVTPLPTASVISCAC